MLIGRAAGKLSVRAASLFRQSRHYPSGNPARRSPVAAVSSKSAQYWALPQGRKRRHLAIELA